MTTKVKVIGAITVIVLSFATGRYTVPLSTKIDEKKTEVSKTKETEKTNTHAEDHKKTTITEHTNKDGTKDKVTVITDDKGKDTKSVDNKTSSDQKSEELVKETVRAGNKVTISALAGTKFSFSGSLPSPEYGAMISRDILGPINLGVFGFSSGFGGIALGVSF